MPSYPYYSTCQIQNRKLVDVRKGIVPLNTVNGRINTCLHGHWPLCFAGKGMPFN
jgi:hypothetical protein